MSRWGFGDYVSAGEKRTKRERRVRSLSKAGVALDPVSAAGKRAIAKSFWGKAWCDNLESYSDYANRLPRGRTYIRNGSVIDLTINEGTIDALVCGTDTYEVSVRIVPMSDARWEQVCRSCAGGIDSMVALLDGSLGDDVLRVVSDPEQGLFPKPREIAMSCSCPDWAGVCKHVAAALYGVGARLDDRPELLFTLRGVDPDDLLASALAEPVGAVDPDAPVFDGDLSAVFGFDMSADDFDLPSPPQTPSGEYTDAERHIHKVIAEWTGLTDSVIAARTGRSPTEVAQCLASLATRGDIDKGSDNRWRAKD